MGVLHFPIIIIIVVILMVITAIATLDAQSVSRREKLTLSNMHACPNNKNNIMLVQANKCPERASCKHVA